jgi:hypothetical protein
MVQLGLAGCHLGSEIERLLVRDSPQPTVERATSLNWAGASERGTLSPVPQLASRCWR